MSLEPIQALSERACDFEPVSTRNQCRLRSGPPRSVYKAGRERLSFEHPDHGRGGGPATEALPVRRAILQPLFFTSGSGLAVTSRRVGPACGVIAAGGKPFVFGEAALDGFEASEG